MERLVIEGISSESYPGGRIDIFSIPIAGKNNQEIHHSHLIPMYLELGFKEDDVSEKLDIDFENKPSGAYFFVYGNKKIKSFIIVEDRSLSIIFDTSLNREYMNKIIEKYFKFPEI